MRAGWELQYCKATQGAWGWVPRRSPVRQRAFDIWPVVNIETSANELLISIFDKIGGHLGADRDGVVDMDSPLLVHYK